MTLMQCGIGLLFLVLTVAGDDMHCVPGESSVWWVNAKAKATFDVHIEPFRTYAATNDPNCCEKNVIPPTHEELQEACHLCYNLTKSTPGFARDVTDCSKFYICEPNGMGGFTTFLRECPKCSFWDQDQLTCVQVWFDVDECVTTGHQTDVLNYTTPIEDPRMFCIDFEDDDLVSNTWGEYRPWVLNDGVTVVNSPDCPQGKRCGFFNESVLEVPFFSNNYGHWPSLRITLQYKMISFSGTIDQGIVSNDCFPKGTGEYAPGNSLFISANDDEFNGGLKDLTGTTVTVAAHGIGSWGLGEMNWVGEVLTVKDETAVDGDAFAGPIRESHCPLMIGAFIKVRELSYFQGYMDNICFYKW